MKPYGLVVIEQPDIQDIREMGAKSCTGKLQEKGGDYRPYCRNSREKRSTRRRWKRKERKAAREEIKAQLDGV